MGPTCQQCWKFREKVTPGRTEADTEDIPRELSLDIENEEEEKSGKHN